MIVSRQTLNNYDFMNGYVTDKPAPVCYMTIILAVKYDDGLCVDKLNDHYLLSALLNRINKNKTLLMYDNKQFNGRKNKTDSFGML